MMRTTLVTLVPVLMSLLGTPSLGEDTADLILENGVFYPVSSPGAVEGAMAIKAGHIAYLGPASGAEAWRGPETRVLDLAGRTVTPGLIDAHSHLSDLGAALAQVDLTGTTSYAEVIERVRSAAAQVPAGDWVRGRGWDQNDWPETRFPSHDELSRAVPDHPVWLTRIDGHAALVNALAMKRLGIDRTIADPSGGRFLRADDGAPSGVLIDAAMGAVGGRIPAPSPEEIRRRIAAGARHCLELGLTTVTEMGIGERQVEAYREMRSRGELPIRVSVFLTDDEDLLESWFERGPEIDPEARLTVRGIKLYADGALGSRGAALVEPYSDDPGNLGLLLTSGDHVERVCRRAMRTGFQVGTHAIGDRGALLVLDAYERCLGEDGAAARFRLEHSQIMRVDDIERMARLGVIASVQPTHATSDMPWAGDRVGPRRLEGAYAWRKLVAAGAPLALGSDFPVESADPRLGLYAAVTRQDRSGAPDGGWLPEERLTREEALRGFTLEAARSLFLEQETGSLDPGKRADLVVFERDIMRVPAAELPEVGIFGTVLDGEFVYRKGESE